MRKIILKNYIQNVVQELVPDPPPRLKLSISLHQQPENSYSLYFIVCPSQRQPKYIEYKVMSACFYLI